MDKTLQSWAIKGLSDCRNTDEEKWGDAVSDDVHRVVEVAFQEHYLKSIFDK